LHLAEWLGGLGIGVGEACRWLSILFSIRPEGTTALILLYFTFLYFLSSPISLEGITSFHKV
jgi:hypothetical protein